jgi:uncharacterized protein YbaR (Trm112 family)
MTPVDMRLLPVLVCPKCRMKLEETADKEGLLCRACELVYPVKDGIPVLLPAEARPPERDR